MNEDWTRAPDGRSNASNTYEFLVKRVYYLILSDAFYLINGKAETTARLIVSQLAHRWGMVPTETTARNIAAFPDER